MWLIAFKKSGAAFALATASAFASACGINSSPTIKTDAERKVAAKSAALNNAHEAELVDTAANLPPCNVEGRLVYVVDQKEFQACENGTWTVIDLTGPAGKDGAAGAAGAKGVQGDRGVQGNQGEGGSTGGGSTSGSYLPLAGGTLTGNLITPANGFRVGTSQLVATSDGVSVGSATLPAKRSFSVLAASPDATWMAAEMGMRSELTASGAVYTYGLGLHLETFIPSGETNSGAEIGERITVFRNFSGTTGDAGTLSQMTALYMQYGNSNGDATAAPVTTNAYGILMSPYALKGTITNLYDLYIGSISPGGTLTNHWGIYQQDTAAKNFFAGNIGAGIGSSPFDDQYKMVVSGAGTTRSPLNLRLDRGAAPTAFSRILGFTDEAFTEEYASYQVSSTIFALVGGNATDLQIRTNNHSWSVLVGPSASVDAIHVEPAGNVGINNAAPHSALDVVGYVQIDTVSGAPSGSDCAGVADYGRMIIDPAVGQTKLYICTASGWVPK